MNGLIIIFAIIVSFILLYGMAGGAGIALGIIILLAIPSMGA
jgi:hypothetical protein